MMQRKMVGGQNDLLVGIATAQWRWIVLAACVPHLAWNLVLALLAYLAPDFASAAGSWVMAGVTILLTIFAATGTTFAAEPSAALRHGVLVGLVAALIGLAFTGLTPAAVAIFGLTATAGAAGGRLGGWLRGS
ncbi:MAG: hypothetical protein ACTHMU_26385 [Thermomicrobiales bacterium]